MQSLKKMAGIFLFCTLTLTQKTFSQENSELQNHVAEKLWYMQKETWLSGLLLLAIIIVGVLYRAGKAKKKIIKKTTTETIITKNPEEINSVPNQN